MPTLKVRCPECKAAVRASIDDVDEATDVEVTCPECDHEFTATVEPTAKPGKAGKQEKQAKPAAKKAAAKKPKSRVRDDDDDEDEDDNDMPRRKNKKAAAGNSKMPLIIGGIAAAVLLIGGVVAAVVLSGGDKPKETAKTDPLPARVDPVQPGPTPGVNPPVNPGNNPNPPKKDTNPPKKDTNPPKKDTNPPKVDPNPPKQKDPEDDDGPAIKLPDPPKIRIAGSLAPGGKLTTAVAKPPATPPLAPEEDPFVRAKSYRAEMPPPPLPKLPPANQRPILTLDPGGHTAFVRNVFVTPKGDQVITVGEDKAVRVWDIRTGDPVQTIRLPAGVGDEGTLLAATMAPNGKRVAVAGKPIKGAKAGTTTPVFIVNVENGTLVKTLEITAVKPDRLNEVDALDFSNDGNRLAVGGGDGYVQLIDVNTGKQTAKVEAHLSPVQEVRFNPNPKVNILATIGYDRSVRIYNLTTSSQNATVQLGGKDATDIRWSPDGRTLAVSCHSGEIVLVGLDGKVMRTLSKLTIEGKTVEINRVHFLDSDQAVACCGVHGGRGWAGVRNAETGVVKVAVTGHSNNVMALGVSADGTRVVSSGGNQHETYVWDGATGNTVSRLAGQGNGIWGVGWAKDGKSLAFGIDNRIEADGTRRLDFTFRLDDFGAGGEPNDGDYDQAVKTDGVFGVKKVAPDELHIGAITGQPRSFKLPGGEHIYMASLLPGRPMVVVCGAASLVLVNPQDGKILRTFVGHTGNILSVAPSPDGKYFVTGSSDQSMRVWVPGDEDPLLSLFVAGRDWIAWTSQGFYACSGNGERLIAWQVNAGASKFPQIHPAARFRPSMYQPAIIKYLIPAGNLPLALAMAQKFDKALVQTTNVGEISPPEVTLDSPEFAKEDTVIDRDVFTVKASAKGTVKQPITALRLLVDGRPFQGADGVQKFQNPQATAEASWDVTLTPGPHSFAVIAETTVSKGMTKAGIVTRAGEVPKPNLYVLTMGVSAYPGDMKLRYAASDARLLAKAFQEKSKGVFGTIEVKVLTDADATKKGIQQAMDWMKSKMTAKDVGIVSFSGHGTRDPLGRFYLVPVDVSEDDPAGTCFSGDEFKARLDKMPGRLVAILDACHSGAVADKSRRPARSDGLVRDLVAEDSGVVVMCASLGREYAIESSATKAGFFTLGLVEGLGGHGDIDQDGIIYINELDIYANARVTQLSGGLQNPTTGRPAGIRPFAIAKTVGKP